MLFLDMLFIFRMCLFKRNKLQLYLVEKCSTNIKNLSIIRLCKSEEYISARAKIRYKFRDHQTDYLIYSEFWNVIVLSSK